MSNAYFNNDDLLFHYTKADTALRSILYKGKLKLFRLETMNDPREANDFSIVIVGGTLYDPKDLAEIQKMAHENIQLHNELNYRVKKSKVVSFTCQKPDGKNNYSYGYSRARMWSQYAEGHQGICLVFSKESLESEFTKQGLQFYSDKVVHDNDELINSSHLGINRKTDIKKHVEDFRHNFFFLKAKDFKDENEHRFVIIDDDDKRDNIEIKIKKCLKAIITSYKFPAAYEINLKDYCNKYGIPWYRVSWPHGYPNIKEMSP